MATHEEIMQLRAAFLSIEEYAKQCHDKLCRYPDADRDWILSRTPNLQYLVDKLDNLCKEITKL